MHYQIHEIVKKIDCSKIKPAECSDQIIEQLKTLGIKLRGDNETDTVNGHLDIDHEKNNHFIKICICEEDEEPNNYHRFTFKKPLKIPTSKECSALF